MSNWILYNLPNVLFLLLLIARLGDILSTYLASPNLKLELNPLIRKFRWPFAWLTLLLCLVPFYSPEAGVIILIPSLLVTASNISKIWFLRSYGEQEYADLIMQLAKRSKLSLALSCLWLSAFFTMLVGVLLVFINGSSHWSLYIGIGIIAYVIVIGFYGTIHFIKIFKKVRK